MAEIIGFSSIIILGIFTVILIYFQPRIFPILILAFIIRISVMLFGYYVSPLPESGGDAEVFEQLAWTMSQGDFSYILSQYPGPDASFISWLIAFFYYFTGRSILMAQSISIFFGISSIFLSWVIAKNLFGERTANKVGYLLALFPTFVLYSTLILRESYAIFFLILAIYGVINWSKKGGLKPFMIAMLGFSIATFFHGGMAIGGLVFLVIVIIKLSNTLIKNLMYGRLNLTSIFLFIIVSTILAIFVNNKISVDKLGTFQKMTNVESIIEIIQVRHEKGVTYPEWTIPKDLFEIIYKAPARALYFIASPFPWNVEQTHHIIGLIDGLIYFTFSILIWKNRYFIWANPGLRIVLIILLSYIIVYGLFIGNYGAVVRHRSKFICLFIILAASRIPKFVFGK